MKPKVKNWLRLIETGELKNKSVKILHFIIHHPHTDLDSIRTSLNLPHQTCSAILSTMMDYGLVKGVGERQKNGLYYSQLLFVNNEIERDMLAFKREQEKFIQWVHRGIEDYNKHISPYLLQELHKVLKNKDNIQQLPLF
jgi:predicted transcriptional regulator